MFAIKLAITKIVLSSTVYFSVPAPHPYVATVDTAEILAGLDKATAKLAK